ncbi:MAG TPA: hypothetical protein V6D00_06575 [Pantanalinema sp.]
MDHLRAGAGAGAPLVPAVANESKTQQEWEYEYLEDLGSDPKGRLNELGKDGWMLVSAAPFIFRRPKLADESKTRGRVGFSRQ